MTRLVIVGAGGHAREMVSAVRAAQAAGGDVELVGLLAEGEQFPERAAALGAGILGPPAMAADLDADLLIGVGNPAARGRLDAELTEAGCRSGTLVHPTASVGADVMLAPGTYVAAGAVLTTNVTLGRHVHVNVGASVHHDTVIGDHCTIGPGARVTGWVELGARVDVGVGVSFRDRAAVGADTVIGAGAAVIADLPPGVTAVGTPARPR